MNYQRGPAADVGMGGRMCNVCVRVWMHCDYNCVCFAHYCYDGESGGKVDLIKAPAVYFRLKYEVHREPHARNAHIHLWGRIIVYLYDRKLNSSARINVRPKTVC